MTNEAMIHIFNFIASIINEMIHPPLCADKLGTISSYIVSGFRCKPCKSQSILDWIVLLNRNLKLFAKHSSYHYQVVLLIQITIDSVIRDILWEKCEKWEWNQTLNYIRHNLWYSTNKQIDCENNIVNWNGLIRLVILY